LNSLNTLLQRKIITVDVETTTLAKGNPFIPENKLVSIHIKEGNNPTKCYFTESFPEARPILEAADLWVTFNGKFDINWLVRELDIVPKSVWDVQLAEFLFSGQLLPYLSLDHTAFLYSLPKKIDKVKEYWDKGIDTDKIPRPELEEYGNHDVDITYSAFLEQVKLFLGKRQHQYKLFRLHCNDLLVLAEMERNGIAYDVEASLNKSKELEDGITRIEDDLRKSTGGTPLNLNSTYHKSVLLYGGTISQDIKLPIGVFKTGANAGKPKFKSFPKLYELPRLVAPLKGSELEKEGYWSTDEPTLLSLHPNKQAKLVINKLLERARLAKLNSTYLIGLPKLIEKMGWPNQTIHTNLNQCVAITGRLSSNKPNVQNQPAEVKQFCISRYVK